MRRRACSFPCMFEATPFRRPASWPGWSASLGGHIILVFLLWQSRPLPPRFSRVQVVYASTEHQPVWLPRPEENVASKGGSIPHILPAAPAASVDPVNAEPAGESEIIPQAVPSEIDTSISSTLASGFGSPGSLTGRLQDIPRLQTGSPDVPAPAPPEAEPKPAPVEIPGHIPQPPLVEPARLLKKTIPVYPQLARTARVEGIVTLQADINESGKLENVTAIEGHPLLIDAAIQAVRHWRYAPARLHGVPTRSSVNITVDFRLIYQ